MQERAFLEPSAKPNEQTIASTFGDFCAYYENFVDITDSFSKDWNFSKRSGL